MHWPVAAASGRSTSRTISTKEALHIEVDTSISSLHLVRIFEQLRRERGLPQVLRTDNGPEFLGEVFTEWGKAQGMAIQYIQPGKPDQNAYIERFNHTFREEVLDQYLFRRLEDVREAAWWWMTEYNEQRPHDSLGDLTPAEYRQQIARGSTFEMTVRRGSLRDDYLSSGDTPMEETDAGIYLSCLRHEHFVQIAKEIDEKYESQT